MIIWNLIIVLFIVFQVFLIPIEITFMPALDTITSTIISISYYLFIL